MSALNDHSSRAHALLSASSSARWLACPPSAAAAALYESADTEFTREGTLAHEIAEAVARQRLTDPSIKMTDFQCDDGKMAPHEMIHCAEAYADYIQELIQDDSAVVLLEQRVDYSPWAPGGFGTCDCLILQGHRLDVIDYKYGQGVTVSAMNNSQMRLYGLGALADFGVVYEIHEVVMHIFQPRLNNVSSERLSTRELLAWGAGIAESAAQAAKGEGDFHAGEHCRFCPHAGSCLALADLCMKVVNLPEGKASIPSLAPWQIADILRAEPMVSSWLKAVKDRALSALLNGEEIPGYKVVEGRGSRDWQSAVPVDSTLRAAGYHPEEYMTKPELLSPAQMEKALGKKKVAELLATFIVSKPGSPTVAPESDKRKPFDRLAEARKDFE